MVTLKPNPHFLTIIVGALLCFAGLQHYSHAAEPSVLFKKYHVHIINNMSDNSLPLLVHCQSRHHDLGVEFLLPSQEYLIRFKVDYFRRTYFVCFVQWGRRETEFTAFKCSRDEDRCRSGNCFWSVRHDGFYFSRNRENWDLEYQWPPEIPPRKHK